MTVKYIAGQSQLEARAYRQDLELSHLRGEVAAKKTQAFRIVKVLELGASISSIGLELSKRAQAEKWTSHSEDKITRKRRVNLVQWQSMFADCLAEARRTISDTQKILSEENE